MESTSKSKALLIESGASNHLMAEKDSFSSLETGKSIPIHMGDDSTIISEGQGTVDLENGFFSNVLYVLSLAANILSVYQMTHIGVPKRVSFIPNDVEITKLASLHPGNSLLKTFKTIMQKPMSSPTSCRMQSPSLC